MTKQEFLAASLKIARKFMLQKNLIRINETTWDI